MQHTLQKRQCRRCYFSRQMAGSLHCVKNPPALDRRTGRACWPLIKSDDICGSFRCAGDNTIATDHWPKNDLLVYRDSFGDYCKIPLTQGRFAKVDPEDYIWLLQFRWHCKTNKASIYAVRTINIAGKSKRIFMHCLIMNTPANLVCDHINHNGLDNRKANLRNCTIRQNNANSRSAANASSKYKGVSWSKPRKKWAVYIKKDSHQQFLGHFDSETEAANAYDKKAAELFGQFAKLNFPPQ